jgi:uncharacterized protein (DUF697 family)
MVSLYLGIIILVGRHIHGIVAAAIALAITLAYTTVSWYIMERRLLGRKALNARKD